MGESTFFEDAAELLELVQHVFHRLFAFVDVRIHFAGTLRRAVIFLLDWDRYAGLWFSALGLCWLGRD